MARMGVVLNSPRWLALQRMALPAILVVLSLISVVGLTRAGLRSADRQSGYDLQSYWYYGHFVRAGVNPYLAYRDGVAFSSPLTYLDGTVAAPDAEPVPKLGRVPANTAPILLLTSLLAYFPWSQAKTIWMICNLAFLIAIPWLVIGLLPPAFQLSPQFRWLGALTFYVLKSARETAAVGQTSLLVFLLMLLTLHLRQRHWLWAGLALGIALGKYSMALPIVIFLLFERRWRLLTVAAFVQVAALYVVASLDNGGVNTSLWEAMAATIRVNWSMVARHSEQVGVHIGNTFRAFPLVAAALVGGITLVTLATVTQVAVASRGWHGWRASDVLPVNSLLLLWILLVVYHRNYDVFMVIMFLVLALSVITTWHVPVEHKVALALLYCAVIGVLSLPSDSPRAFLSDAQADLYLLWRDRVMTMILLLMWGANWWLLTHMPRLAVEPVTVTYPVAQPVRDVNRQ